MSLHRRGAGCRYGFLLAFLAARAVAQDPSAKAFDLERRGQFAQAAELYRGMLASNPIDLGALLGLERSLQPLNRLPEMIPLMGAALGRGEPSAALFGLGVRVYSAARLPDSARLLVDRWARFEPRSEGPYQEWGNAALGQRDRATAKLAYTVARERLGKTVLAGEVAYLATAEGDFATAVPEWLLAIDKVPGYRSTAVSLLGQAAPDRRTSVLRALGETRKPMGERLAALLTIRWGDPVGGVRRLERVLPALATQGNEALQEAVDELRGVNTREGLMARGITLDLLSQRVPPAQVSRFLLDAAQAYAEAGDQSSARRMLARLAGDPAASPGIAASATSTLVTVLVAEGKLEDAEKQFQKLQTVLGAEERERIAQRVAEGWIRAGRLDRADNVMARDSSVEGLALRGRIKLYQGDLGGAAELLRSAGPFAGEREGATARISVLAILQVIDEDSLPALGTALLKLERRDSLSAATDLEVVGGQLPPDRGGAELLLFAGRIRAGLKQPEEAERLLQRVTDLKIAASAAAAELELARIWVGGNRRAPAIQLLEHLLVTYPASAVVPQARRLLDVAKGAVPPV